MNALAAQGHRHQNVLLINSDNAAVSLRRKLVLRMQTQRLRLGTKSDDDCCLKRARVGCKAKRWLVVVLRLNVGTVRNLEAHSRRKLMNPSGLLFIQPLQVRHPQLGGLVDRFKLNFDLIAKWGVLHDGP